MTPYNALWNTVIKRVAAGTLDYAEVWTWNFQLVAHGPDPAELLKGDVRGHDLYCFLEPGSAILALAKQAGICNVYSVLSRQDAERLGLTLRTLRPKTDWRVRKELLEVGVVAPDASEHEKAKWARACGLG
jgi:hypothetical protein